MRVRISAVCVLMALIAGCGPEVVPTTAHPPTSPDSVRILGAPPKKYEQMGTLMLEITPDLKWDEKAQANKAFDLLKAKAARQGANAIGLWTLPGVPDANRATAGYNGTFHQVPVIVGPDGRRTAVAQALWVVEQ